MKVIEHIKKAKGTLFSIEVLPPLKGKNIKDLFDVIDPLMEFNPPFVDVTYHREEIMYKKRPDGLVEEVPLRKRPGTVGICAAIQARYKIDAIPHLVCGGFTKEETEDALFSLHYLEIENVLLLKGDPDKNGRSSMLKEGYNYASDLVEQVKNMNKGKFLHEETSSDDFMTDFCIGVAGYPEKHFEAPNKEIDLAYLKNKVDKGADYIVTQMFFNNKTYFDFVDKCRAIGITVPIIPGIKPLTSVGQLTGLPPKFFIDIPNDLASEIRKCKNNADAKKVGVEWAIQQCKELKEANAPSIHFYTMSRYEATLEVARAVF